MRATLFLATAIFALSAASASAQTYVKKIIEPVTPTVDDIINAPIEYDDNGVVKAQYFKADDLSEAEYRALLEEADRIRAFQGATSVSSSQSSSTYAYPTTSSTAVSSGYEVEIYQPSSTATSTYTPIEVAPTEIIAPAQILSPTETLATTPSRTHRVAKGDTLYNISKRYGTDVASIKAENGLLGTNLSIGQQLSIPGVYASTLNSTTTLQPIFASAPVSDGVVTRRVIEQAPLRQQPVISSGTQIYAVLPKDTLYSISRRTCVGVQDLIIVNSIQNPNNLQPGQKLTLPSGHCLPK